MLMTQVSGTRPHNDSCLRRLTQLEWDRTLRVDRRLDGGVGGGDLGAAGAPAPTGRTLVIMIQIAETPRRMVQIAETPAPMIQIGGRRTLHY